MKLGQTSSPIPARARHWTAADEFAIDGPNWHGDTPKGIDKVFRSETDLILTLGRTALNGASDVKNVEAIQYDYPYRASSPVTSFPILPTLGVKGTW